MARGDHSDDSVQAALKRALWRLTAATIFVYVALASLGAYVYVAGENQRAALNRTVDETTGALCTLRHDLEVRVETSRQFLRDNPQGIPGIPPAVLKQSIKNQQNTIEALSPLDCKKGDSE